jgi:uncharacterized protein (TIGR03437 family)
VNLRLKNVLFLLAVLVGLRGAHGQTASGSGLLSGTYVFREFDMSISQMAASQPTYALSGTIVFNSGSGSYTVTGTKTTSTLTTIQTVPFSASNSWSYGDGLISITDPLSGDTIEGAVSQGVIVASAPNPVVPGSDLNIFIAIPMGSLNSESFTSVYQTAVLDFSGEIKNAFLNLSPDGKGGLGTITLNGQETNAPGFVPANVTQSVSGASYSFNGDGSATLTVPANPLFTGTKTVFASPDGNFILGWTPGGLDIFFGVKALAAGTGTNGISQGIYFTAGFDVSGMLQKRPLVSPDFYFGTYSMTGDANGDALVQQVTNLPLGGVTAITWDFATDDQILVNPDGTAGPDALGYRYAFGAGGNGFVAIGTQGIFGLVVGVRAAAPAAVAGVYVNRATVVNAASYQPVIAGVAPGELITLFGSGLASTTMAVAGGEPVPLSLGGVSTTLNGIPCPVFAVSPSQISILVPYGVAAYGAADLQVTNNGVTSNVVSVGSGVNISQPGVFSQSQDGIGFAAARHAATEELVDQANPAQPGEYITIYTTGLGTVTPAIADGAVGPSNPLSTADCWTNGSMSVVFNDYGPGAPLESDVLGTIQFAGLAPGLAGLYQVNVQVPTKGLTLGDLVEIELQINHERLQPVDIRQVYIPYGPGAAVPR